MKNNYRDAKPCDVKCPDCVMSYKLKPRGELYCEIQDSAVAGKHTCDKAMLFEGEDELDREEEREEELRMTNADIEMDNLRDLALEDGR